MALGKRDLENGTIEVARRDTKTKETVERTNIDEHVDVLLKQIQQSLFDKALQYRTDNLCKIDDYEEFKKTIKSGGGLVSAHWDGTAETEEKIKQQTKATIRCIPIDGDEENGECILPGKPAKRRVIFAKAY